MSDKFDKFEKQQILNSKQFTGSQKDLLTMLLEDNKTYSIEECNKILKKERERVIK